MEPIIENIQKALMNGNAPLVKKLTEKAISIGVRPINIIKQGLEPGMLVIGKKFRDFEISIPDVLMISRAMHAGLYVLKPLLSKEKDSSAFKARIVLGTVAGDLHDIGKNMLGMILEQVGYEVIDIGIDVPAEDFLSAVKIYKPQILGMSALLTTSMGEFREVINCLKEQGLRENLQVIVGGRPVTAGFALSSGADIYAVDAWDAVNTLNKLFCNGKKTV